MDEKNLDVVGYWTEIKLNILEEYSSAYSKIMRKQSSIRHFSYIDAFAGAGTHLSKATGEKIEGSPTLALQKDFSHYHFIDLDETRIDLLKRLAKGRSNVSIHLGDCNQLLLGKIFPLCKYEDFRRALCLLDPYGLNPKWEVVQTAGQMKSIEIFLNFMIMDANMNVFWKNPDKVPAAQVERMNAFWGDDSWRKIGYKKQRGLFGDMEEKSSNEEIADAYKQRLLKNAGFKFVPNPIPMRNSKGAVIYYLYFASHNEIGNKIALDIFKKYSNRGVLHGR